MEMGGNGVRYSLDADVHMPHLLDLQSESAESDGDAEGESRQPGGSEGIA
jgi:hypothetical protein